MCLGVSRFSSAFKNVDPELEKTAISVSLIFIDKSLSADPVSNLTQSYTGHSAYALCVEAQL